MESTTRLSEQVTFETLLGRRAGLHWALPGAPRVLCIHGWLDNAESFTPLAPQLDHLELFAVDLPGHGHSEHRHLTARYHFIDYLWDIDAILDALGWSDCHLLGHSMGAAISAVYSAGAPERVRSAVLLDTLGPISVRAETATDRLRRSLIRNRMARSAQRTYSSIDEMIAARRARSDLSEQAARLLCERSAHQVGDHFEWRSDPALNWISSLVMTDAQALDFLENIEAPVLSLMANPAAPWASAEKTAERRRAIRKGRYESIDGHHHFHMDEPEKIGGVIQSFILEQESNRTNGDPDEQARQERHTRP